MVNTNCEFWQKVLARIEQTRVSFFKMKNVLILNDINLFLKIRLLRRYILSVLLYGCEFRALDTTLEGRIKSFEMYVYRCILKIPWVMKVLDFEMLHWINKKVELLHTIKELKLEYLSNMMKGLKYKLLSLITEDRIAGKRSIERQQNSWMKCLDDRFAWSSIELFKDDMCCLFIWNVYSFK